MAARDRYAGGITGFMMAACSCFVVGEARSQAGKGRVNGSTSKIEYPGDAVFLEELSTRYKEEFLSSHVQEKIGLTYSFVQL